MPAPKFSDADFVQAWRAAGGSPTLVAERTGWGLRSIYRRRAVLAQNGTILDTNPLDGRYYQQRTFSKPTQSRVNPARLEISVPDGVVMVFSDAHYWPGDPTPAHVSFVKLVKELRPVLIVANGDMLDGATISRHDREGWNPRPTLAQELEACKERLGEIEDAALKVDAELIWNLGNHDQRFERHLAMNVPAFEGVPGLTLPEHFPRWTHSMSVMINPDARNPVMVKHRNASGLHAAYNNALRGGISVVTGHLHRLVVTTWGDYRGRRYGVDTGTLADIHGPQFAYAEDNPTSAGQGFAVLTFHEGDLLTPELAEVRDGRTFFRGAGV